jgi:hypothetical protein
MRIPKLLLSLIMLLAMPGCLTGAVAASGQAPGDNMTQPPAQTPLAATVLGQEVRTDEADRMQDIVLSKLFDRYAEQQGIEATDAEMDAFVHRMRRGLRAEGLTAEGELSPEEAAQAEKMHRDMARAMIRQWKLNRSLYRQYGGRVIYQQLGPEPLDAYRRHLEERQAAGDFVIHEKAFEKPFWRYFTDDSIHSFYESGSEAEAFEQPPWEQSDAGGE